MTDTIQKRRALVASARSSDIDFFTALLKREGVETFVALDAESAVTRARLLKPGVVILDEGLPNDGGYETCRRIKSEDGCEAIPTLILASRERVEDGAEWFHAGAADYIAKPPREEETLARVFAHISLGGYRQNMNRLVTERTEELSDAVRLLKTEVARRKRMEQELTLAKERAEEMSRLKSSFLANINHEFRTPMTGILGLTKLLASDLEEPDQIEMAENIEKAGRRLMRTLNSIIYLSALESEKISIMLRETKVDRLVKELQREYEAAAEEKGLTFALDLSGSEMVVCSDERYLAQALGNILDNAVKFTVEGGVTLAVAHVGDPGNGGAFIEFRIKDTGVGVEEEFHDVIFEEYRQVSEGLSRSHDGMGIGLSIARKMINLMNGEIELTSEPGGGSEFLVRLPAAVPEEKKPARETEQEERVATLLVEDNEINRDVTNIYLRSFCDVVNAADGLEALERAQKDSFDLVLMDINLGPGIDGVETFKRLRKIEGFENTPVVALTGYANIGDREKLLEEGFTRYLAKPFQKEDLVEIVQETLAEKES